MFVISKIKIAGAEDAIDLLDRLRLAAKNAEDAILSLNGHTHNGISVKICGSMAKVDIAPSDGFK